MQKNLETGFDQSIEETVTEVKNNNGTNTIGYQYGSGKPPKEKTVKRHGNRRFNKAIVKRTR